MKRKLTVTLTIAALLWLMVGAVHAHDMHGMTHDHASGWLFLAVWLAISAVIYVIDTLRGAK